MACRSRVEEAPAEVRAATGSDTVEGLHVDLTDPAKVDALCDTLRERGVRLDRLVINAGVVPARARTTPAGLDIMVHTNFLANVQLVDRLLADGTIAPDPDDPPRIVVVGSESHRSAPPIDHEHLWEPRDYGTSEVVSEYGKSKLLLHTWVCELTRRLEAEHGRAIAVHHLCPGAVASSIAREAPRWMQWLLVLVFKLFFQSPARAAEPVVWLVAADDLAGATGVYLHMRQRKAPAPLAADPDHGARLWEAAHAKLAELRSQET
jgi:NAD(P)-dependent dehydrogenase (short-subunit alcohol dehydrogenase family)